MSCLLVINIIQPDPKCDSSTSRELPKKWFDQVTQLSRDHLASSLEALCTENIEVKSRTLSDTHAHALRVAQATRRPAQQFLKTCPLHPVVPGHSESQQIGQRQGLKQFFRDQHRVSRCNFLLQAVNFEQKCCLCNEGTDAEFSTPGLSFQSWQRPYLA